MFTSTFTFFAGLSLITWQMAQGTKPFQGMSRKEFFHHVVHRHFRPPIDPRWPHGLRTLIERSWDPDYTRRPTAREYVAAIDEIAASITRHRRNSTSVPSSLQSKVRSMFQQVLGGGVAQPTTAAEPNQAPRERRRSGERQEAIPLSAQVQPVKDHQVPKAIDTQPHHPGQQAPVTAAGHKRRNSL